MFWWVITLIITWIIINPLLADFIKHDFVYDSIFNVIVFITVARYILFLKYTLLSHFQAGKLVLIFIALPLVFYIIQEFFAFHDFLESEGTAKFQDFFREDITMTELYDIVDYTTKQLSFFAIAAAMCVIIMPFRMLISFWRVYNNTGTV